MPASASAHVKLGRAQSQASAEHFIQTSVDYGGPLVAKYGPARAGRGDGHGLQDSDEPYMITGSLSSSVHCHGEDSYKIVSVMDSDSEATESLTVVCHSAT